jgi:hypothetical protein
MSHPRSRGAQRRPGYLRFQLEQLENRVLPCVETSLAGVDVDLNESHPETYPAILSEWLGSNSTGSGDDVVAFGDDPGLVVPAYSSLPGAPATIYLDFNGHFDSQWGSYSNVDTPAYDIDGDPSGFNATELNNIYLIWQHVAEDYAPFNVNVTTVSPPSFANGVAMRAAIGGNGSWTGGTYGGIGYINAFTNSIVNTAYIFPKNLGNGTPRYVADAVSHEIGHSFGLQHQSQYSGGNLVATYYSGPGDGTAPIMGNSYNATRSMWWYGTSTSPTTYQNDMAVIAGPTNGFGYRTDDHGNTTTTASTLTVTGTGDVSGSGLIGLMTDLDYFSFVTGSGTITLNVSVDIPFNILDSRLELRDASGNIVASADPSTEFGATITYNAGAGTYYLVVASHGISAGATATNYGFNVGSYSLSGTIIVGGATPPVAPSNLAATAISSSQINLSWTDNSSDEDGFRIERLSGANWVEIATVAANVTTWQNVGLTAGTTYTYRVRAYNAGGNSGYSTVASATTDPDGSIPAAPSNLVGQAKNRPTRRAVLTWTDNANNELGFKIERSSDGGSTWTHIQTTGANITTYTDASVVSGATYLYRVRAYNAAGDSAYSNSVTISFGNGKGNQGGPAFGLSDNITASTLASAAQGLNMAATTGTNSLATNTAQKLSKMRDVEQWSVFGTLDADGHVR